jgi:hypothetical protein
MTEIEKATASRVQSRYKALKRTAASAAMVLSLATVTALYSHVNSNNVNSEKASITRDELSPSLEYAIYQNLQPQEKHPVYPYSLVPGGVYNKNDLESAEAHDPLLQAAYGTKITTFKEQKLVHDEYYFVSYRKDGKEFWTAKPVKISAGEEVVEFTGDNKKHLARGRCGNLLMETPQTPISRELAPPELDTPIQFMNQPQPLQPIEITQTQTSPSTVGTGTTGTYPIGPVIIIPVGGGPVPPTPPIPPIKTSENFSDWILFGAAVVILGVGRLLRDKDNDNKWNGN